jgi:hypothetical protein
VYLVAFESNTFGCATMKASYSASSPMVTSPAAVTIHSAAVWLQVSYLVLGNSLVSLFFVEIRSSFLGDSCQKRVLWFWLWEG